MSALALALAPHTSSAQQPLLRGYYLNVAAHQGSSPLLGAAGVSDFQRLRLMLGPRLGPVSLDVAYEQTLLWQQQAGASLSFLPGGAAVASNDWLTLDWTVDSGAHYTWRQRFDRLSLDAPLGSAFELTVGRQVVSWATTLFFTPTDPFAPFDPSDPFREYRAGIDAARLQYFAGPFTTLDLVVRPEDTPAGYRTTALLRGRTTLASWGVSAWAGALHGEAAAAAGAEGALGAWAVRADVGLRRTAAGSTVVRAAIGADRRLSLLQRDLHVLFEMQHDGFGAASSADLANVLTSLAFRRGDLQVLGRDEALADVTWQVHPLIATELLVMANLRDGSALFAPGLSASLSDEVSARAGLYLGAGDGRVTAIGLPRSEYGAVPAYVYIALTAFF